MFRKSLHSTLIALSVAAIWASCLTNVFAGFHGHRRFPTGSSTPYPNATSPHGGFSSSNGYYSGRSRIVDVPSPPAAPALSKPAPTK
jgi:hypothetical protein